MFLLFYSLYALEPCFVRILSYQNCSIPLWHETTCEDLSAFEYRYNLTLFYISPDENVRKIGFFMEILVTTSALRPLTGATWSDARTTCQPIREEISLHISTSQDETNFTRVLVRNQQTAKLSVRGLGSYRNTDNVFYWIDDTPLAEQYSAWKSGERYSHNLNDEKCVHLCTLTLWPKKYENGRNDRPCMQFFRDIQFKSPYCTLPEAVHMRR